MSLQINNETVGTVTVLALSGDVDLSSAVELRANLAPLFEAEKPRLLFDLSHVGFMDSTGIGIMVNALNRVNEKQGACAYCGAQARVQRILQIAGLLKLLPLHESRDLALAALDGSEQQSA